MSIILVLILSMIISSFAAVIVFFSILKASLGVTGSLVAVLLAYFGFAFFKKFHLIKEFSEIDVNLVQTATSAAGSISASTLFLLAYYMTGNSLTILQLILFLFISGLLGVCLAIPLRYYFIVKEELPFPSGTACYNLNITLLDKSKRSDIGRWLGTGLAIGAIQKIAIIFKWIKAYLLAPTIFGVPLPNLLIGVSTEPLLIGIGLIVGPRIALTLGAGSFIIWAGVVPLLCELEILKEASFGGARSLMVYAAISWLITAGVTQLLISITQRHGSIPHISNSEPEHTLWILPYKIWFSCIALLLVSEIMLLRWLDIPIVLAVIAVVGSLFFAFVSIKCLGSTDMNPLSTLSNLMLFIQAKLGSVVPIIPASATTVIASLGSDTMQDYKTGHLLKADAIRQTLMQIIGIIVGSIVLTYLFTNFIDKGIIVPGNQEFPAATSMAVAELSRALTQTAILPPYAILVSIISSIIAVVFTIFELKTRHKWAPSSLALGIVMILPPFYAMAIAIGGLLGILLARFSIKRQTIIALGAGLILADSLLSIISLVLR